MNNFDKYFGDIKIVFYIPDLFPKWPRFKLGQKKTCSMIFNGEFFAEECYENKEKNVTNLPDTDNPLDAGQCQRGKVGGG